jgi:hypothetical protein
MLVLVYSAMGLDSCECFSFHHPGVSLDGFVPFVPKASLMKAKAEHWAKKALAQEPGLDEPRVILRELLVLPYAGSRGSARVW